MLTWILTRSKPHRNRFCTSAIGMKRLKGRRTNAVTVIRRHKEKDSNKEKISTLRLRLDRDSSTSKLLLFEPEKRALNRRSFSFCCKLLCASRNEIGMILTSLI